MKKISAILLCFLLLFSLALPTIAGNSAEITASVSTANVNLGSTVTVTFSLKNCAQFKSMAISPDFDKNTFEFVSGQWLISDGAVLSDVKSDGSVAAIAFSSPVTKNTAVFKLTLKVKTNASFGNADIGASATIKNGATEIPCNDAEAKITIVCNHTYSAFTSAGDTQHQRTCSKCHAVEKKNHTFSNDCDTTCNDCGFTRTITHKYSTKWSSNSKQHWHVCSVCENRADVASHVPGAAATEDSSQKCTVCNKVLAGALEHVHTYSTEWKNDANGHYNVCASCGEKGTVDAHKYDNDCDATCNVCSYTREVTHTYGTEFKSDETNHWHECGICKSASENTAHVFDNACDGECDDCGYTRVVNHEFDEGKITLMPTEDKAGKKEFTCKHCGEKKTTEFQISDVTEPVANEKGEDNTTTLIIIAIIAAVAVAGGVTAFIIKKKND